MNMNATTLHDVLHDVWSMLHTAETPSRLRATLACEAGVLLANNAQVLNLMENRFCESQISSGSEGISPSGVYLKALNAAMIRPMVASTPSKP